MRLDVPLDPRNVFSMRSPFSSFFSFFQDRPLFSRCRKIPSHEAHADSFPGVGYLPSGPAKSPLLRKLFPPHLESWWTALSVCPFPDGRPRASSRMSRSKRSKRVSFHPKILLLPSSEMTYALPLQPAFSLDCRRAFFPSFES